MCLCWENNKLLEFNESSVYLPRNISFSTNGIVFTFMYLFILFKSRVMCHITCMEFRGHLWQLILSFHRMIPKNQTQVIRFGRKFLYTLSHLTGPSQKILKCLKHCLYCLVQKHFHRKCSFPLKKKKGSWKLKDLKFTQGHLLHQGFQVQYSF